MPITHFLRTFFTVLLSVFVFSLSYASAKEMTQAERNEMAAKLIPIITMLLMDGDSIPPPKPSLTTPLGNEVNTGTVSVEVNGEVGAKVFANGVQVGVIGSSGKATVVLTFVNGVNAMSITLQDSAGNESDPLTFSVSYDAPPVITLNGDAYRMLTKGEAYTEEGAVAEDANDGGVAVTVNGMVDTNVVGDYNITYSATDSQNNTAYEVRKVRIIPEHAVVPEFAFDSADLEGYNGTADLNQTVGVIETQYWIYALNRLTEAELIQLVLPYSNVLTVLGYSDVHGLLVEIPKDNIEALSALKTIALEKGVIEVSQRVHVGKEMIETFNVALPDDGSVFYDMGDNWHLEYINIEDAWNITTGSSEVAIGVIDGGFHDNHEDLSVDARNSMSRRKGTHGTASASIIGAKTDNKKGLSGINWVSDLVLSSYLDDSHFEDILDASHSSERVKVINLSYGPVYFKNNSSKVFSKENGIKYTRDEKRYTKKYDDRLFVFAAGNKGQDAEGQNGALHFDEDGLNTFLTDNIIVVGAVLKDGTLPNYSNYGDTVDIVAPTAIKAAAEYTFGINTYYKTDKSYYGTNHSESIVSSFPHQSVFDGTSAAAPVVSGVASLIYSVNPNFSPQLVKKFLIRSASKFANRIHTVKDYNSTDENNTEPIPEGHAIPILDAGAALQLAKDYTDAKKVDLTYSYPSAFSKSCKITVESVSSNLTISSFGISVQGVNPDDSLSSIPSIPDTDNHEVSFDTSSAFTEYIAQGTVTYAGLSSPEVYINFLHNTLETTLDIKDKITNLDITDVTVTLEYLDTNLSQEQRVLSSGAILYFEKRKWYKIHVEKTGYKTYSEEFRKLTDLSSEMIIKLVPNDANIIGTLHGIISDDNGSLANAYITLFSTNKSYTLRTGASGIYRILDVPIVDDSGAFIWYDLNVSRAGYISKLKRSIGLSDGKATQESFTLKKDPNYTNTPPATNAGADVSIVVGESVTLSGELSSDDETPTQYLQYKWSGATIATSYEQNVTLLNLSEGTYTFTLEVTDEEGAVATDTVTVTVAPSSGSTLKKTGQTTSYADYDDGYYQKGVTPSYSRANEVVTDNVTGLQWQDNAEAKTVTKTWDEAQTYCSSLGLDGGGWRLPTVQELQSIVVGDTYSPSIDTLDFVNYTIFSFYWSSTTFAGYTSFAWYVDFYNGLSDGYDYYDKSYTNGVRCVR